jgi:hypothetical protein
MARSSQLSGAQPRAGEAHQLADAHPVSGTPLVPPTDARRNKRPPGANPHLTPRGVSHQRAHHRGGIGGTQSEPDPASARLSRSSWRSRWRSSRLVEVRPPRLPATLDVDQCKCVPLPCGAVLCPRSSRKRPALCDGHALALDRRDDAGRRARRARPERRESRPPARPPRGARWPAGRRRTRRTVRHEVSIVGPAHGPVVAIGHRPRWAPKSTLVHRRRSGRPPHVRVARRAKKPRVACILLHAMASFGSNRPSARR